MNAPRSKYRLISAVAVALAIAGPATCAAQANNQSADAAVERARQFLSEQHQVASSDLKVTAVTEKTWPDSSLGCRQPGMSYAQVISKGHVVLLNDGSKTHEVHVSGKNAVSCEPSLDPNLRAPRAPVRATYLPELEQKAREDLAKQLGADIAAIQVIQRVPKRWTEASLQCQNDPVAPEQAEIGGFKLYLRHKMRTYTYHTDERRVFACPVIAKD